MQSPPRDMLSQTTGSSEARDYRRRHLRAIVDALLSCEELDDPRWHSLALVASVSRRGRNFGNSGYAYGDGKSWWAFSLPVLKLRPPVLDVITELRGEVPEELCRVLLQYDRRLNRARLVPEFENPAVWDITPQTARTMIDTLRPDFQPHDGVNQNQ